MKYLYLAFLAVLLAIVIGRSDAPPAIEWTFCFQPICQINGYNESLEFGLHPNGTVVWRKKTILTNSPAELFSSNSTVAVRKLNLPTALNANHARIQQPGYAGRPRYTSPPELPGGVNATYPTNIQKIPQLPPTP